VDGGCSSGTYLGSSESWNQFLSQNWDALVDVVINCSGVFRDLFINQMNLLDQAVKMAAEADEPVSMNYVRKHATAGGGNGH